LNKKLKVAICAGGTGGHIYPAVAIARKLIEDNKEVGLFFVGSGKKIEKDIFSHEGFRLETIASAPFKRVIGIEPIKSLVFMFIGFVQAVFLLLREKPSVVLSMGGYTGLSVVFAAKILRIPVVIHEQNVLPGVVNKICSKVADKIAISFEESKKYFRSENVFLNPVRQEIATAKRIHDKKTVLIVGGSQGARSINQAAFEMLPQLKDITLKIIHISGQKEYKEQSFPGIDYKCHPYIHNMAEVLASTDLVISRSGATILSEIAALSLPSILIPYPYSSENHQELNAKAFSNIGAAILIKHSMLSATILADMIKTLINDETKLKNMSAAAHSLFRKDAAEKVVELIYVSV